MTGGGLRREEGIYVHPLSGSMSSSDVEDIFRSTPYRVFRHGALAVAVVYGVLLGQDLWNKAVRPEPTPIQPQVISTLAPR